MNEKNTFAEVWFDKLTIGTFLKLLIHQSIFFILSILLILSKEEIGN